MAFDLGTGVNKALRTIGEPDITTFDADNQLQNILIDDASEAVHDILEAARYRWGLHYDAFTTTDDISTEKVAVTNASTTTTSVDDDGANAQNFTLATANMWFRVGGAKTSYGITSVDNSSNPHTLTLDDAYVGTTAASSGYRLFQDTYSLNITDLDEIMIMAYGDAPTANSQRIKLVDMRRIVDMSGGDIHRDTSGKPRFAAEITPDSSDVPQVQLWPFPTDQYLISVWHTLKFTSNTTFSTNLFGGDAPDIAYDTVAHHLRWRACLYDEDKVQAREWWDRYERGRFQLVSREHRTQRDDTQMTIETYRRTNIGSRRHMEVRSQIAFDTV
jgi:hypothetical protein